MIPEIHMAVYSYPLDDARIAKYPLAERDASKLLHYGKDGSLAEYRFRDLPSLLPEGSLMVFNDTKVVPARLHFEKESGAHIEIFCLEPENPVEYNTNFAATDHCSWKCVIGNAKRWKGGFLHLCNPENDPAVAAMNLRAELLFRDERTGTVRFVWDGGEPFSRVLERCGTVPIPPYLNRESEPLDSERYQTLYARWRGSVAAPTAGLHFTEPVLEAIRGRGIAIRKVCLHVGAGTFLPVKTDAISGHTMHREPFSVTLDLLKEIRYRKGELIAVGTTSVRTLESLYYAGLRILREGIPSDIGQWDPYEDPAPSVTTEAALDAIIAYLESHGMNELRLGTRIIIVPGFRFRLVDRMVTNFHQPESTLILLVSAFVGGNWRPIYDYALAHGFRFLSYGDSSLLDRTPKPDQSMTSAFDDIRPYNDAETVAALSRVARHPVCLPISRYLYPGEPETTLGELLLSVTGVDDFQHKVMDRAIHFIVEDTTTSYTYSGIETLQRPEYAGCHLFLSNHRDIVLDPAITQIALVDCGLPTTEICVGDNLLSEPIVEDMIRSNRMIKVRRGVSGHELYESLQLLSRYIHESITSGRSSVWLAQRQGRTKDGCDMTEEALIKMLGMSAEAGEDFAAFYKALRIVPLSISYEYDPCDILKAREVLIRDSGVPYEKKPGEDLNSIVTGIRQPKGRVHLQFNAPLTDAEIDACAAAPKPQRVHMLCQMLDERILGGYRLWDTNYIAWDLLNPGSERFQDRYTPEARERFIAYTAHQLESVEPALDRTGLRELFLGIYANPVYRIE